MDSVSLLLGSVSIGSKKSLKISQNVEVVNVLNSLHLQLVSLQAIS